MTDPVGQKTRRRTKEVIADLWKLNAHYTSAGRRPTRFVVEDDDYQAVVEELKGPSFHGVPIIKMSDANG